VIIVLDFPDMSLSPNRKAGKHWTASKKAKDARAQAAFYSAKEAIAREGKPKSVSALEISFISPDKRKRDLDNLLSAIKCDLDFICRAIGIDDSVFNVVTLRRGYRKGLGQTIVRIIE
jgi:crossover junction endodeoxyribonuclease RusA